MEVPSTVANTTIGVNKRVVERIHRMRILTVDVKAGLALVWLWRDERAFPRIMPMQQQSHSTGSVTAFRICTRSRFQCIRPTEIAMPGHILKEAVHAASADLDYRAGD